jgi:hypothetical protein
MQIEERRELFAPSERERLLAAITALCEERGYGEISSELLLERAEVSVEIFEEIFAGGIEECLLAAVSAVTGRSAGAVSSASETGAGDGERILITIKEALESMAAHPGEVNLGYVVARQMSSERIHAVYEAGIQMIVLILERLGARSGERPQSRSATRAGVGGAEALVRREILAGRGEELVGLLPQFVYSATVGMLGQSEAMRLTARARELVEDKERG